MSDAIALNKIRECVKRANAEGRDVVEYLARYGWLATPSWQNVVEVELIDNLITKLADISVAQIVGGAYATGNWTADHFMAGVLRFLKEEREKV